MKMLLKKENQAKLNWNKGICLFLIPLIFQILIGFPSYSFAYPWELVGPEDLVTTNYSWCINSPYHEVICTQDGFHYGENWPEYSYGDLPVWDIYSPVDDTMLVILGDGSWSDGVYKFSFDENVFEIGHWIYCPHFILEHNGRIFVGGENLLIYSDYPESWVELQSFVNISCLSAASYGEYIVMSTGGMSPAVLNTTDNGDTWNSYQPGLIFSDLAFDPDGVLYGVFAAGSDSDGLWSSEDFGETWNLEFYSSGMSTVSYQSGFLFVGWNGIDRDHDGIAIWDRENSELVSLNDGLPNLLVNNVSVNPFINCLNVLVCTDAGVYMNCELPEVFIEEPTELPQKLNLICYPNPFNSTINVHFSLKEIADISLKLFTVTGREIASVNKVECQPGEHHYSLDANEWASGMYFIQVIVDGLPTGINKVVLLR